MLHLHFQRLAHSLITVSLDYFYRWGEYGCTREWLAQSPVVPVNHRQQQLLFFFLSLRVSEMFVVTAVSMTGQVPSYRFKHRPASSPEQLSRLARHGQPHAGAFAAKKRRHKKKGSQKQRNAKKNGPVLFFNQRKAEMGEALRVEHKSTCLLERK